MVSKEQRWLAIAGIAAMAAAQLTEQAASASWRFASGKEPPEDPGWKDVSWSKALLWSAALGAAIGVAELVAQQTTGRLWKTVTGKQPPRPKRRVRR